MRPLALLLAFVLAGCAALPLSTGGSSGSDGGGDDDASAKVLLVLLVGAWGLWLDSQKDACKVPEKCEPEFTP